MTANEFRRIALQLPEASEGEHMGHADFRVRGKIFATLGHPQDEWGMVKLTPQQQAECIQADAATFAAVKGGWGRRGATQVRLRSAKRAAVRAAMIMAWRNTAPAALVEKFDASM